MAKWGFGDPRWIVEERPDATNVNNWHWSEKNASQWSKDKLKSLLLNLKIEEPGLGCCEITEVSSIEGEAVANNRKGKLIFFYEWVLKMTWKGRLNGQSDEAEGQLEIPNLSEENTPEEIDVNVSVKNDDLVGETLKQLMMNKGTDLIREQLAKYIKDLRDDFAKDLIKPTKLTGEGTINSFQTSSQTSQSSASEVVNSISTKQVNSSLNGTLQNVAAQVGVKIETKSLELKESLKCTAEEFHRAMTTVDLVQMWTMSKAMVDPVVGGRFELLDGNICGSFTHLAPNCIKQRWRHKSWPDAHYSEVTIDINQKEDCTEVVIKQTGIPNKEFERTECGWRNYYFEGMKRRLGFGAVLQ